MSRRMKIGIGLLLFAWTLQTTEAQNQYNYNNQNQGFDYSKTYPLLDDAGRQVDLPYDALRYEVTENVIDIPNYDVRPPIVANFSLPTAIDKLNNATDNNSRNKTENNKTRKKYFNLNINAEIGSDKPDNVISSVNNNNVNTNNIVLASHINNFNNKLRTVLVNLVKNVNKAVNKNSVVLPNVLGGPVKFFNKVHKQKDEVFSKIHDALDNDDDDDDLFDEEFDPLNF